MLSPPRQPRHICARTGSRGNCARVSCKLPFSRSAVKQKYINDAQTFFSPHWLAFLPPPPPSRSTVPLAPISQHSLIFSPSLTYPQPLPPSTLFTPAALLSVPPLQATCYSVQGGCRQHYSSSAYCCCRRCCCSTTLFHPPPPPLSVVLSDNQTFSLVLPPPPHSPETVHLEPRHSAWHFICNPPPRRHSSVREPPHCCVTPHCFWKNTHL